MNRTKIEYLTHSGMAGGSTMRCQRGETGTGEMTAADVLTALLRKHGKDLTVTECKDGPSFGRDHVRMDLWAMRRSWAKPCITAYEIKVARGDFLRDDKWRAYLDCCNELYFACPWKLIAPEEVPEHVGLRWVSRGGSRVVTKKKAKWRECNPELVYKYILICRARITGRDIWGDENIDWRQWLAQRADDRKVGRLVSIALQSKLSEARQKQRIAEAEAQKMRRIVEGYEMIRKRIEELGHDPDVPVSAWNIDNVLERVLGKGQLEIIRVLRRAQDRIGIALNEIEMLVRRKADKRNGRS